LIFSGKREVLRTWFILLGSTLVILAILMTPLSLWLWEHMPLLKQVQFPWRILADGILVMAAMAGVYAASLENRLHSAVWFWIGMALLILPNLSHIGFEKYYPVIASEWTPAAIAANAIETTANAEFEPRWVKQRMPYTDNKAFVVSGSAVITRIERRPTFWQLETQGQTDALIEAALLYFPGWTVSVDGRNAPIEIPETGRIQFRVPSGMHQVSMEFKRTTARFLAELVSLLALSSVIVLAYFRPGPHSK
jgi:hypothetical protein